MSLHAYCRELRFCPECNARLTTLPTKPDQNQTRPHHRKEHRIDDGVYNHSLGYFTRRNPRTTDEDGRCAYVSENSDSQGCGERPNDLPDRIASNQDVSLAALVARLRQLYSALEDFGITPTVAIEDACDYVADEKHKANPPPDDEILRAAIEDVATGDIETTAWRPVTDAARTSMADEARRSPVSIPYRKAATDGGRPDDSPEQ